MLEEQVNIKTPEYVSLKFSLAGLGSRAAAFVIDQLVIGLLNVILYFGLFFSLISSIEFFATDNFLLLIAVVIILTFVIEWTYFIVQEFFWSGRTIGKRIIGIRTIQENGQRITLLASVIRNLVRIIDSLPTGYLLGIIMIFFHSQHKRLGDLAAGTIVVHESHFSKKKNKQTPIEKIIADRGWSKESTTFEEWQVQAINQQDWELLHKFCERYPDLPLHEKSHLTKKVAEIIFPKIGLPVHQYHTSEMEKTLFIYYLYSKEEWDFHL